MMNHAATGGILDSETSGLRQFRRVILLLLCAFGAALPMAAQGPAPGKVVEKVVCRHDLAQSYALYLPSYYSADREWPILYALDAGARGVLPVRRFQQGAERYGYIVAGSNNSRNGPIRIVEEAMNALIADTNARFALDEGRVYLAGFSGGGRVAVAAAVALGGKAAGVIGCGAGFPPSIEPSASLPFAFFGAVGAEDFTFPELRDLDNTLEKLGIAHRLEIFQGGHEWPPEAVCTRAIEFMEIQAMKSGIADRDQGRIDEIFRASVDGAESCEKRQEIYGAYQRYSNLAKDFQGLKDVASFAAKAAELAEAKEVRKSLDREKATSAKQKSIETRLHGLLAGAVGGDNRAYRVQDLISSFVSLRKQADRSRNEIDRLVAVRVMTSFWITLGEAVPLDFERKDLDLAVMRLELMSRIRPENSRVYYHIARAHALEGDRKKTLKALDVAIKTGFKDAAVLENNADFEIVRDDPAFLRILDFLKK